MRFAILATAALFLACAQENGSAMRVERLRCEYHVDPIGLDVTAPRLSWIVTGDRRGERQTAYRILVASSPGKLDADQGDLWDTDKVASAETNQIVYDGATLRSGMPCWWKVRAWDAAGQPTAWSDPATWSMGLLQRGDWQGRWIGYDPPADAGQPSLEGCVWVWLPEGNPRNAAPPGTIYLRRTLNLAGAPRQAHMLLTCDDQFVLFVNGREVAKSDGRTDAWRRPVNVDLHEQLVAGDNVLAIQATNATETPAGLTGRLEVDGQVKLLIDDSWRVSKTAAEGWRNAGFDDSGWPMAKVIAQVGDEPWGVPKAGGDGLELPPAPFLRRDFEVGGEVKRAVVYATALGLYELHLNGRKVGDELLRPGWTDYHKRIPNQAYDVTDQVQQGPNTLGAILADGWYAGYVGLGGRERYGRRPRLLVQMVIERADGTVQTVYSDGSWRAGIGPILHADLLQGETYDARAELGAWDQPGYDAGAWSPVVVADAPPAELESHAGVPVRKLEELPAQTVKEPKPGTFVFDLGQNLVGWVRLKVAGPAGTEVTLRHAEMLNPDGTIYTANLRGARCIDHYTLKGGGTEVWEPRFTFHGFRYVELTGYPGTPGLDAVTGIVVGSDTPQTGSFECSDKLLNQLQHNIIWGQRGNYLEVPTDCPQRDERLGWMGDAQVFIPTACFNADVAAFFTKWLVDVEDAQAANGAFTDVAPRVAAGEGTAAWGDAGVICPWVIYQHYGDTRVLAEHFDAMGRWVEYCRQHSKGLIRPDQGYGDWLAIGADTPKDLLATAYFARSTDLTARTAAVLGKAEEAAKYGALFQDIKAAFNQAFVAPDGTLEGNTQSGHLMALAFDLLPDHLRPVAVDKVAADIEARQGHLTTGFVGCGLINPTLTRNGRTDVAWQLMMQQSYPSWLYPVLHGATTIWERWDGWTEDKGFQNPGMNSFNHYAFGAVGEWMYETIGGIGVDPAQPGYRHILVQPQPGDGVTWAKTSLESIRGRIAVDWRIEDRRLTLDVTIPANTTATVRVPTSDPNGVTESGHPAVDADGLVSRRIEPGALVCEVAAGRYVFSAGGRPSPAAAGRR